MDIIKSFISLLVLINPIGAIPLFISLTAQQTVKEKRRTIRVAAVTVTFLLIGTALVGNKVLEFFGIGIASFQVAGGILILLVGLAMVNAQLGQSRQTNEEREEAEHKPNIAVVPLAIPLLAGPGAMSTVIIYAGHIAHWYEFGWLIGAGIVIGGITWAALSLAVPISNILGKTGINIATRLMGLLLMAISIEFMVDGLTKLFPVLKGMS